MRCYLLCTAVVLQLSLIQGQVHKYGAACEGGTINLRCAADEVICIDTAFYGRTNAVTCTSNTMSNQNCVSASSQYIVSNHCNAKQTCSVFASFQIFQDPCAGTSKYMEITYHCVKSDIRTAIACNGKSVYLSCPSGQVLEIVKANYGRTNGVTCPSQPMPNKNCHAVGVTERLQRLCNCNNSCSAAPNMFGDPCYGTTKYFNVQYRCVPQCQCKKQPACCKPKCPCAPYDDNRDCDCDEYKKISHVAD